MKILHVDMGNEWRGGQRQCLLLHEGLLGRGFDSSVVCLEGGEFSKKNIRNTVSIPFGAELSGKSRKSLKAVINKFKPDIVQSHDAHSLTPLLLLNMFGLDFTLIGTRRVDFSVNKNFISLKKYKNKYVNIVAVSEGIKKVLINDGLEPKRVKVIHDGVPPIQTPDESEIAAIKKEFGIEKASLVLGNVANFAPHKDYYTLLRAYKIYSSEVTGTKLLLVGAGPLFEDVRKECAALGLNDSVVFTGFRPEVSALICCMDIFTVSSYLEGLNTSIIDAMYLRRPVVGTDTGGIPELVEDGATGYLAPPRNPENLAEKMILLSRQPDLRAEFGKNAFIKAYSFTDDIMVEKYIAYYKELLK